MQLTERSRYLLWNSLYARPEQLPPPGDWTTWIYLAGRGAGKTRAGSEWVRAQIESGACRRMALVARTPADVRDVMVEGESGILAVSPPWFRPAWNPSIRRLTWPNGAIATTYSSYEPDQLRGPQHDGAWADELCSWRYPETWDQLQFGLRLGNPRVFVSTTPRPSPLLKRLLAARDTVVTRGTTYDNLANLAPRFREEIIARYEGTRLGRQELLAEILEDAEGALWQQARIDELRVKEAPALARVVVAVDPATTSGKGADETGIVVAGVAANGHGYVLEDLSMRGTPHAWGSRAVMAYHSHRADRLVAETNNGGEMVELTIRTIDPQVSYRAVTASRGKVTRAEPVAALYEQGKVHHVGSFPELEDQMCQWTPGESSPDRLDALVWALTEVMPGLAHSIVWTRGPAT